MALETGRYCDDPESSTRSDMRAVGADLRHLEGCLAMVRRSADESDLYPEDEALARLAGRQVEKVAKIARRIESELAKHPAPHEGGK